MLLQDTRSVNLYPHNRSPILQYFKYTKKINIKMHNFVMKMCFWKNKKQEMPQCDKTRFSTLQPSIDMTGIKNERWQ